MHENIIKLLREAKVISIATQHEKQPHLAICYYAFYQKDESHAYLLFKSSEDTQHIKEALQNPKIACSILPNDKMSIASNRGIQLKGHFISDQSILAELKKHYEKKFPMAKMVSGRIWGILLTSIKMTDNRLGFGKKLYWEPA